MATGSRDDAERRFWERYRNLRLKRGVKPTAVRWHVLLAEQFIQSFSGRRLAELARRDVDDYLARQGQDSRLQPWQFRQAVDAIRNLYSIARTEWAKYEDWALWRDSARTLEEQHATTARQHTPVTAEEFTQRIDESRFAPLIRNHLDLFARFSTVICTRGLLIRTGESYIGWCCRLLPRFEGSRPESLGAPEVGSFLAAHPFGDGVHLFFRGTMHRYGFQRGFPGRAYCRAVRVLEESIAKCFLTAIAALWQRRPA